MTIRTLIAALALWLAGLTGATRADSLSLALQEGGTAAWEIAAMQALGLDRAHGITLSLRPVADSRAGQIALHAGEVDVILSDFIWASLQRQQGADFTFVPHSLTVGALMVPPNSTITTIDGLAGRTIAVAGGPVDKSWLVLQALYHARTGGDLSAAATVRYGAAPLVNELLAQGHADAALNFWHFNARARASGMSELISVPQMLGELGVSPTPPLLGWVFSESWAAANPAAIRAFLDASFATKAALLTDDGIWDTIRPLMQAEDDALFLALRDGYRAGIVTAYDDAGIAAATAAFALMAQTGGAELIGDAPELAPGTFWAGYRR